MLWVSCWRRRCRGVVDCSATPTRRTNYRTAKLERGTLQAAVSSSGTVNPVSQVSVGSQVSGQIKEMLADFNTEVKQGQLIARIDPESFEYKVRQASADLDSARAAVLNAQANVGGGDGGVSKARLDADNAQRDLERKQELLATRVHLAGGLRERPQHGGHAGRVAQGHAGAGRRGARPGRGAQAVVQAARGRARAGARWTWSAPRSARRSMAW